jgi:inosine triphosphate pyrophosphatase
MRVNAAPGAGELDEDGDEVVIRRPDGPGLLGVLKGVLGEGNGAGGKGSKDAAGKGDVGKGAGEDDYQRFLEGLHDLP